MRSEPVGFASTLVVVRQVGGTPQFLFFHNVHKISWVLGLSFARDPFGGFQGNSRKTTNSSDPQIKRDTWREPIFHHIPLLTCRAVSEPSTRCIPRKPAWTGFRLFPLGCVLFWRPCPFFVGFEGAPKANQFGDLMLRHMPHWNCTSGSVRRCSMCHTSKFGQE